MCDIESHYDEKLIKDGYIARNGNPQKCECGCKEFKTMNEYFEFIVLELIRVEYQLYCANCGKTVGIWAYGYWQH